MTLEKARATQHKGEGWTVVVGGHIYGIYHLGVSDEDRERLYAYQRLRAHIFVHQLHWDIPVTEEDREHDQYDQFDQASIHLYCVAALGSGPESILGGIRIIELSTWEESMVMREFKHAGLFPDALLSTLKDRYACQTLLELTRFCVHRPQKMAVPLFSPGISLPVVRDFTYTGVYRCAEQTARYKVLAVVSSGYLRVMQRAHFVFEAIYTQELSAPRGYALVVIDLVKTIRALQDADEHTRARRMLILCTPGWMYTE